MFKYFLMLFFTMSLFVSKNTFAVQIIIEENEWPCKLNHLEDYKLSYFWSNNNIALNENWKKEKDVYDLVIYITNHANAIHQGTEAINKFASNIPQNEKKEKFNLVFSGVFQEMSIYLKLAKHGVFQFITRVKLAEQELIKENKKNNQKQKYVKQNIGRSKKGWLLEIADDAEEEAEFQCQRMDFLEKKTMALTKAIRSNL